jgi:hypothetical protein
VKVLIPTYFPSIGVSTLEILFPLFGKEFREGPYTPQSMGTKESPRALRGINTSVFPLCPDCELLLPVERARLENQFNPAKRDSL